MFHCPSIADHPWTLSLTTGSEKGQGYLGVAYVTVYGEKNQSQQLPLGTSDGFDYTEGATDDLPVRQSLIRSFCRLHFTNHLELRLSKIHTSLARNTVT